MNKAILATVAVLGSSTVAMADSHVRTSFTFAGTVSVPRPVTRPIFRRPVATTVSVPRPVTRPFTRPIYQPVSRPVVSYEPVRGRDRDRGYHHGHGPVVTHPIVIQRPVYRPIYEQPIYEQPVYEQPVYEQPVYVAPQPVYTQPAIDNCNGSGTYVGPIGSVPNSYDNSERSLTEPTQIRNGREIINLGAQVGPIDDLIIEANNNATSIQTVQVNFLDGSSQRFDVRETLDVGNPQVSLQLGHRDVASLIVYGQSTPGGTYQILAT